MNCYKQLKIQKQQNAYKTEGRYIGNLTSVPLKANQKFKSIP
jgi:hypothetical protein